MRRINGRHPSGAKEIFQLRRICVGFRRCEVFAEFGGKLVFVRLEVIGGSFSGVGLHYSRREKVFPVGERVQLASVIG